MIRAFLALPLPETVQSALRVQQFLLPLPRQAPTESFHLTLVFLGEVPERALADLHDLLQGLRIPGFDLSVQGLGLFGGATPHTVWAGVAPCGPLARLQAKVERLARQAGCRVESRRFAPHVTLGRFSRLIPDERLRLERAVADSRLSMPAFAVSEFALYQSTQGKGGSRYDELARYALA